MERIALSAWAKVNLTLSVTGRRPDGYHTLETVFQRVSLGDRLSLSRIPGGNLILEGGPPGLPAENNIIARAWGLLRAECPGLGGISAVLEKNIPVQGGMGGGSADCAAFLLGANRLLELGLSRPRLLELGARLGADVPVCMAGGAALGRGVGEQLEPIASSLTLHLAVVKPPVSFSTPEMFRRLDARPAGRAQRFTAPEAARALEKGDLAALCGCLYNIFEELAEAPVIGEVRNALRSQGALGALMTGSGSCVFGIFAGEGPARRAAEALRSRWPAWYCRSMGKEELLP